MIAELVTFTFHSPWDRARELEAVKGVVPKWAANPELVRKYFLWGLGEDTGTGAGFYIWPSIEAAQRAHNEEWREAVKKRTGGYPTIRYFDLLAVVDNEHASATEWNTVGKPRPLDTTKSHD